MLLSEMANAQESHSSYHQSEPSIRIFTLLMKRYGLPWWLSDKNSPAVQKTQVQSLDQEDPLEKKMATHSSILAWEIPWTEEPGGLQSMGLRKSWTPLSNFTASTTVYIYLYLYIANFSPWFSNAFQHKLLTQTFSLEQSEWCCC